MKTLKIKNLSAKINDSGFSYKEYMVELNGKSDKILFAHDDWGLRFEPYSGTFSDADFDKIKEVIFDDAYYNKGFSIY